MAMASPTEKKVIDEIEFVTGKRVFPYVALAGPLMRVINAAYEMRDRGEAFYIGPRALPRSSARRASPTPEQLARRPARKAAAPARARAARHRSPPAPSTGQPGRPPRPHRGPAAPRRRLTAVRRGPADRSASSDPDAGFRPAASRVAAGPGAVVIDDAMGRMAARRRADRRRLRRVESRALGDGRPRRRAACAAPARAPGDGRQTILVVDDEPDIRKLVRRVPRGARLPGARGRAAGTRRCLLKEQPPDLVDPRRDAPRGARLRHRQAHEGDRALRPHPHRDDLGRVQGLALRRGPQGELRRRRLPREALQGRPTSSRAVETALSRRPQPSNVEQHLGRGREEARAGHRGVPEGRHRRPRSSTSARARASTRSRTACTSTSACSTASRAAIYDAIQELATALDINRQHFPALKNLAVLYQKAGFRNKAIETWERALRVAPDDPTRQSIKEHLVGLL